MLELTLLDYGVGNIHSLKKALEGAGAHVRIASERHEIASARALVLPGVGAFGKVAEPLHSIREELLSRLGNGLPALCVCIGMQALYESSEEAAGNGIGLLPGTVRRLNHSRLPHIGWNSVEHPGTGIFAGIPNRAFFYFVHSYAPSPCTETCIATCDYGGRFAAAVRTANTLGVQFHPEKSSDVGQRLLKNFIRFAERA